ARDLRAAGIHSPVLVLGACDAADARWAAAHDVRLTINDMADIPRLASLDTGLVVHVNIDTGMGRTGILDTEARVLGETLARHPLLRAEALFTHFASADAPKTRSVSLQQERFARARASVEQAGIHADMTHVANSAAIARFPAANARYVRPGIALYGCNPDPGQDFGLDLRPVAALKAGVAKVKKVPSKTAISYGGHYVTKQETHIATIPIGYAHGLPRLLSGKGEVLVKGRRYRIVGNVTMDYVMIDAGPRTDIVAGDEAVAIGRQGNECIHPDEVARIADTIGYEILCGLNTRIDRYYIQGGKIVSRNHGIQY
ncbi:MAG: alanine racemase, partial [Chitinivibrionales bacterium]|nr:alanine racemase [Chitinivibrionales bacterium]MBD3395509.1 alanine racemase [Chitinivibrionales bacterium]